MTTAGQICNIEVVTTGRNTTVADAAKLMRERHVGTLVVVESDDGGKRPLGIVTDRDMVMEVLALDGDPYAETVEDIMVDDLATVRDEQDVREALELMRHRGVRRLPVVNSGGYLLGIVALDDLSRLLAEDMAALAAITAREQSREAAQRKAAVG